MKRSGGLPQVGGVVWKEISQISLIGLIRPIYLIYPLAASPAETEIQQSF